MILASLLQGQGWPARRRRRCRQDGQPPPGLVFFPSHREAQRCEASSMPCDERHLGPLPGSEPLPIPALAGLLHWLGADSPPPDRTPPAQLPVLSLGTGLASSEG